MNFDVLALICAVALIGPLLSLQRFRLPVVIGELLVGIVLGKTGFEALDPSDPTLTFMGQVGFAMVMFVAGTHVPVRDPALLRGLGKGAARAAVVGVLSVPAGLGIAWAFGDDHGWLYAVLLASSSAGLILPTLSGTKVSSQSGLEFLVQLAVADVACIVALPLAIDPANASRAAFGTIVLIVVAAVYFVILLWLEETGRRASVHKVSERRKLAIELRVVLVMLFGLAGIAVSLHVSVMLAGFATGIVVGAVGQPKRVANQMLALSEGFFGPIFFVWLGASLELRGLAERPQLIPLGVAIGVTALVVHGLMAFTRQPVPLAFSSAAQLGVPIGAAAMGSQLGIFVHGEATALLLGALVTIVAVAILAPGIQRAVVSDESSGAELAEPAR